MMIKLLGIIGGICFGYCGVPAAYQTYRAGKSIGTPVSIAWLITVGAVAMYSYLSLLYGFDFILTVNYGVEALSWGSIVYFHYRPRK